MADPVNNAAPVMGTDVSSGEETIIVPSPAAQNAAADRARGRTSIQAGTASWIVLMFEYLCALQKWDLDPWSDGTGFPGTVTAALVGLITTAAAFKMNPKTKS